MARKWYTRGIVNVNDYTRKMIDKISRLTFSKHFVLLSGGNGVGKTFLAREAAKRLCAENQGVYKTVSLHRGLDHNDFIQGYEILTVDKKLFIKDNARKIFMQMWDMAKSYGSKHYVVILDDVQRTNLFSLFGDELNFITENPLKNFFIIATMNTAMVADSTFDYSLFGKFYMHEIKSDYEFIRKDAAIFHDHGFTEFLYNKTNSIVRNYLNYSQSNWQQQFDRYKIGHGYFVGNLELSIRHRIIPLLREYVRDGVLTDYDGTLPIEINSLLYESYDEIEMIEEDEHEELIEFYDVKGKNVKKLYEYIYEIYRNRLIGDDDFFSSIINNEKVFKRVSADITVPYSASLFTNAFRQDKFYRITERNKSKNSLEDVRSKDSVKYYSEEEFIRYRGKEYFYPVNATYSQKGSLKSLEIKEFREYTGTLDYQNVKVPTKVSLNTIL